MLKKEKDLLKESWIIDAITNKVQSGLFLMDDKTRVIWANKRFRQWFGPLAKIIGKPCFYFIKVEKEMYCACIRTLESKRVEAGQAYGNTPKTRNIFFESITTPIFDKKGRLAYLMGEIKDITKRKKAQEQIISLSKFPEENPNIVLRFDMKGKPLLSNPSVKGIVKLQKLKSCTDVFPKDYINLIKKAASMNKQMKGHEHTIGNMVISYDFIPIAERGYVNVYGRDITRQKKAEAEVRSYTKELEKRVSERTKELDDANIKLRERVDELERFHNLTVGRELKMIELKKRIKELEKISQLKK